MATGRIVIETPGLTQENLDDMATAEGWTGERILLDENGNVVYTEDGQATYVPQTAQEFIADKVYKDMIFWAKKACYAQQELQGKLNYDAETKTAQYAAITTVTCELIDDEV